MKGEEEEKREEEGYLDGAQRGIQSGERKKKKTVSRSSTFLK